MKKGLLILAAALMTLAPVGASAAVRGFIAVGRPYYGGGFYSPFWGSYWGPYWSPVYGGFYAYPNSGEVKLDTKVKDAQVFINGAYAARRTRTNRCACVPATITSRFGKAARPNMPSACT